MSTVDQHQHQQQQTQQQQPHLQQQQQQQLFIQQPPLQQDPRQLLVAPPPPPPSHLPQLQPQQVKPGQFQTNGGGGGGGGGSDSGCCAEVTGRAGELLKKVPPCTCKSIPHASLGHKAEGGRERQREGRPCFSCSQRTS